MELDLEQYPHSTLPKLLWAVLGKMGFGPQFISWVKLLYADPVVKICSGSLISGPFALGRGTRQGCPLSPLLFVLATEPLACMVRSSPAIVGFKCVRWRKGSLSMLMIYYYIWGMCDPPLVQ